MTGSVHWELMSNESSVSVVSDGSSSKTPSMSKEPGDAWGFSFPKTLTFAVAEIT
jgi:hypothetical protein